MRSMQGCNKQRTGDASQSDFKNCCCRGLGRSRCLVLSFSCLRHLVDKAQGVASDEADRLVMAFRLAMHCLCGEFEK